jgi:hypothetical protein
MSNRFGGACMLTRDRIIQVAVGLIGLAGGIAVYVFFGDLPIFAAMPSP